MSTDRHEQLLQQATDAMERTVRLSRVTLWFSSISVLLCVALFVWQASRGASIADQSEQLGACFLTATVWFSAAQSVRLSSLASARLSGRAMRATAPSMLSPRLVVAMAVLSMLSFAYSTYLVFADGTSSSALLFRTLLLVLSTYSVWTAVRFYSNQQRLRVDSAIS